MDQERKISPLPTRTKSLLRSSIILPSFPSIASELVYNSLDASATSIHLTVDLSTWSIHCKDNGNGIPGQELSKLDRYSTSKVSSTHGGDYGFRGEALESMQDLGMLHIVSRASNSDQTFEIIKRNGETLEFGKSRTNRDESGTTVSVRDIFYKVSAPDLLSVDVYSSKLTRKALDSIPFEGNLSRPFRLSKLPSLRFGYSSR